MLFSILKFYAYIKNYSLSDLLIHYLSRSSRLTKKIPSELINDVELMLFVAKCLLIVLCLIN